MVNQSRQVASLLAAALIAQSAHAFVPPAAPQATSTPIPTDVALFESKEDHESPSSLRSSAVKKLFSGLKKTAKFLPVVVASAAFLVASPDKAEASAPVMAMPKADERDPASDALESHQRRMQQVAQEELRTFTEKARQIEVSEGPTARADFEEAYKANKKLKAQEKLDAIEKLKNDLLDQGICPFIDIEGQRQMISIEKGVDLGEVSGTAFNLEKEFEKRNPQQTFRVRKQANREVIKCMVEDMRNRDIDPVDYFKTHQQRTAAILELPAAQATSMATTYRANLDLYGQITVPKEGETSAKEIMAKQGKSKSKEEAKRIKAEAKAKAAALKAEAKAMAKEEKQRAKDVKQRAKAEALALKEAENKATEAATAEIESSLASEDDLDPVVGDLEPGSAEETNPEVVAAEKKKLPIVPAATVLVTVGGGGYALKMARDKAADEEAERQRQFQLLMGGQDTESSPAAAPAPALEEVDADLSEISSTDQKSKATDEVQAPQEVAAPKKKKKRGFFGKKKNNRETDITALVSSDAMAPAFATVLAKILTFGAPGRFPEILALPGDMPMQEFSVEAATGMLVEAQANAGLSRENAAEIFANVVNCMLIDIVDLASTSLKEKDSKLTVEAIGIVIDFMNHASSLYNSIAEGVVIVPVTYGGDLAKGKLEQMYSAYAVSAMTNLGSVDEDFDDRVRLLQDVFQINEKKAEGLMMKAMQKNMMEMMKSGEGMEGLEEMMKGMGDMGDMGMPGMPGMDGEEPSPEQLKEMLSALKELKDSGSIPDSELAEVKKQFREAFGSSIDEVMKDANNAGGEMSTQDKELLELMKSILD
ncbi:unnamed protein product [Cylindrotheca closterium]|uniref:Uncharacterized protein n=1 Tax=Cylindrotheca closterium TaxID=2856 RepID=A0AAD2FU92_9STRA|nr:unnamed protein product [Cylindrotheca closterium]